MQTSPDLIHFVIPSSPGFVRIVLANSESVQLQAQCASILLNPISLRITHIVTKKRAYVYTKGNKKQKD